MIHVAVRVPTTVKETAMSEYATTPACKMLATHCVVCGRPLLDSVSVTMGIGPECRKGEDEGIGQEDRQLANKLVFEAALAAQSGHISKVLEIAGRIADECDMEVLADKVRSRFTEASKTAKLVISVEGDMLRVATPFRRKSAREFIDAWRGIPGRRFRDGCNWVPQAQRPALWGLLKRFFPGEIGLGPKGVFRVPVA